MRLMGSQICFKSISINASLTFLYSLFFMMHALIFKTLLLIIYDILIIPRRSRIQKSSRSRFRMNYRKNMSSRSHLSLKIYSVPQSILHSNLQDEESSSISLLQKRVSVNDEISKEYATFVYETLNDAIQLIT